MIPKSHYSNFILFSISTQSSFKSKGKDVTAEFLPLSERSLLAVQGPTAVSSIQNLVPTQDLQNLFFMTTVESQLAGVKGCRITRCGYTGEDGIEISVPSDRACEIAETVLNTGDKTVKLAGLGARDSLRYQNDFFMQDYRFTSITIADWKQAFAYMEQT